MFHTGNTDMVMLQLSIQQQESKYTAVITAGKSPNKQWTVVKYQSCTVSEFCYQVINICISFKHLPQSIFNVNIMHSFLCGI